MPDIDASIWKKYKDKGVLVYGLHGSEPASMIADFKNQTGVTFPIRIDQGNTLSGFAFPEGVGYPYPRDVVVDKKLVIRAIRNSFNVREMDQLIQRLLKE